jgi:hypothetical protein
MSGVFTNMRNDVTVPFGQLRGKKQNDVTDSFWITLQRN